MRTRPPALPIISVHVLESINSTARVRLYPQNIFMDMLSEGGAEAFFRRIVIKSSRSLTETKRCAKSYFSPYLSRWCWIQLGEMVTLLLMKSRLFLCICLYIASTVSDGMDVRVGGKIPYKHMIFKNALKMLKLSHDFEVKFESFRQ